MPLSDCDLDIVVVAPGLHMRRHDDACTRVGIDHGVFNQVADRDTNLSSAAQDPGSGSSRHGEGDPLSFRIHPACSTASVSTSSMSTTSG